MADKNPKSSQSDFVAFVAGVPGPFARCTGGWPTGSVTKDRDGGATKPDVSRNFVDYADLTVTRGYRSARDSAQAKKLLQQVLQLETTITRYDLDKTKKIIPGTGVTFSGLLTGVTGPDMDANGTAIGELGMTFSISDAQ